MDARVESPLPFVTPASVAEVLRVAAEKCAAGHRGALATVVARFGSAPGTPGQKLYLGADGKALGTVGGGGLERAVLLALEPLAKGKGGPELRTFRLGAELGMCCGGRVSIMLEPLAGLTPCLVVGAGHVASALVPLLLRLGFSVTVVDEREEWASDGRFAGAHVVWGEFDEAGRDVDASGVCLVMTHDHALDQRAVEWALARGFRFVGGVGSRAKAERTRQRLLAKGASAADIARVRMPLGLDIGARLPDEIAVAIAAELIAARSTWDTPDRARVESPESSP